MNKTKKEIAYECTNGIFNEYELGITGLSKAMDEYSKQECIEFGKFVASKGSFTHNTIEEQPIWHNLTGNTRFTTEQLYELYLQSKTKQ